ncbi:MAG: hypothetical protein KDD47_26555, partial [Acidobacteria bacterium]|nr:hypothetical protein [Acidobacteriota bacterium]
MPATKTYKTPGVYVAELDAFPPSVVGVQTAVPAFIGYTEKAEIDGKPVFNQAVKINSMADYEAIFGGGFPPKYLIAEVTDADKIKAGSYDFKVYDPETSAERYYNLDINVTTRFALYPSMELFYANGGGSCYVVSVGKYGDALDVSKDALIGGLDVIREQQGPTMLVVPDATLLAPDSVEEPWKSSAFAAVVSKMLTQCGELQDRVAILDVYGAQYATKTDWEDIIERFRIDVGEKYLSYGMAYFPFLDTSVVEATDFTYLNVEPLTGDTGTSLSAVLTWENANLYNGGVVADPVEDGSKTYQQVQHNIELMGTTLDDSAGAVTKLNQNLVAALSLLSDIEKVLAKKNSVLPPSGAMAGVYT